MPEIASTGREAPLSKAASRERKTTVYDPPSVRRRLRIFPVLATLFFAALAGGALWILWQDYMSSPWTRDGTVRAYVVRLAPEVSGRVVDLPIKDNQYVKKGELLMKIDPRDYNVAVDLANAAIKQAQADLENKIAQRERRKALSDLAASKEERQTYTSAAEMAEATLAQQKANLTQANNNLARTELRSPVNGWVTNLLIRQGDYATAGQQVVSIVDADSFWMDGYFEETALKHIKDGDPAKIWLLGYNKVLHGHVDSVSRGIVVSNATPGKSGLATVNPIFTWVRLAQRVPVRIDFDEIPKDLRLVVGMTGTIEVEPKSGSAKPETPKPETPKSETPRGEAKAPEGAKEGGGRGAKGASSGEVGKGTEKSSKSSRGGRRRRPSVHVH
ncbi:HlyD family secretion protein [Hyphomicrobium sp.]|uniref:HlyD family secretion protein n=1 Tax=Hyphomicrobium sp. TaxID=82 RepID=UPI002D76A323|nr:HlyD family secretion protein [Hyphomicrobium sp.]HET6390187.1 HlyD family secretion protein [Hyphomicrobium sp.]